MTRLILASLLSSSLWMAAVGIYCQVVHYPSFRFVQPERFFDFTLLHRSLTGVLVGPPLLVQILATMALLLVLDRVPLWAAVLSLGFLAFSVGWTALVSGPLHGQIALEGPASPLIGKLIDSCWVRNAAWAGQSVLALFLLAAGSEAGSA